ncbi:YesL family protein [Pseudactinotalea terrae]|uniref:YesL family protein n=1 Tax=Pseudactinotalea terrae TaxID=1743262 RepID=UPI0012E1849B|nr:DUF624 domain-containing protein [Pseudactinotalea terrae]
MFSFEGFARLNGFLSGVYRMAWLNILWVAVTLLGLVVVGFGPASYAIATYVDRWFRLGQTPPVTRTFLGYCREQGWRPVLMGWILLAAAGVITVNLLRVESGTVRALNVVMLAVLGIIAAYVFFVMAALDVDTIPRQLASAVLLGVGSLHLTIIGAAAVAGLGWLLAHHAAPLLLLFGVGLPATAAGLITRRVLSGLDHQTDHTARVPAHSPG